MALAWPLNTGFTVPRAESRRLFCTVRAFYIEITFVTARTAYTHPSGDALMYVATVLLCPQKTTCGNRMFFQQL